MLPAYEPSIPDKEHLGYGLSPVLIYAYDIPIISIKGRHLLLRAYILYGSQKVPVFRSLLKLHGFRGLIHAVREVFPYFIIFSGKKIQGLHDSRSVLLL